MWGSVPVDTVWYIVARKKMYTNNAITQRLHTCASMTLIMPPIQYVRKTSSTPQHVLIRYLYSLVYFTFVIWPGVLTTQFYEYVRSRIQPK